MSFAICDASLQRDLQTTQSIKPRGNFRLEEKNNYKQDSRNAEVTTPFDSK